jgi:hypothetical protein
MERSVQKRETPVEAATIKRNKLSLHRTRDIIKESRHAQAGFLAVEIELGLTFVELAKNKRYTYRPERRMALKKNAQLAASTVERLKERLDKDLRETIDIKLAELERAISSL